MNSSFYITPRLEHPLINISARRCARVMQKVAWVLAALVSGSVSADEGGTSFWLPGQYGSLAAAPAEAGWSLPIVYFHSDVDAAGGKSFSQGGDIRLGLDVEIDLFLAIPTYVFESEVWGGQAAVSMAGVYGRADVAVDATLSGPNGGVESGTSEDSSTAIGDLFPSFTLRWNDGVHNTMTYAMAGVPVGEYDKNDLANLGTNHWSFDLGGGYTYFNPDSGREFSATLGATYNFENSDTDYQNGIDMHLDWGASQFISEKTHIGLVGYYFEQVTGDSGDGAQLGSFKSRVGGIGPQIGHLFAMGDKQAYVNLKGYWEFDAKHRPEGWNAWLTLSLPL